MKKLSISVLALSVLVSFSACSTASDKYSKSESYAASTTAAYNYDYDYIAEADYEEIYVYDDTNFIGMAEAPASKPLSTESVTNEKKIIKNASTSLEALDVLTAYNKLSDYIKSVGGYEFSRNQNQNSNYVQISAVFKAPPDKLDEILAYTAECAEVRSSNTSSDDITNQYYDMQLRLENKRKNLEKYYEYLAAADTVEEMIQIQSKIDQLIYEIESYEGQLRQWNTYVEESTINVTIHQKDDPNKIEEPVDWSTMSGEKLLSVMGDGFKSVLNGILTGFQWLLIIIVSILPLLLIAGVVILIVILILKKKKKKVLPKNINDTKEN